ncbi:lipoprotein-releasing system transmembrane subunit LolC, partial [Polaromonas sp. CT11-55]
LSGLLLGLCIAFIIDVIVPAIVSALNACFLPKDIYLMSRMPSEPQYSDIMTIVVISLLMSFMATIYPSRRASRVNPAE